VLGTASTSQILEWSCARKQRRADHDRRAARRALEQIGAVRVGRARTIGRPMLWRLKQVGSADGSSEQCEADKPLPSKEE
jgi:hypothetical protein